MIEVAIGLVVLVGLLVVVQILRTTPYEKGEKSFYEGEPKDKNPYGVSNKKKHLAWSKG